MDGVFFIVISGRYLNDEDVHSRRLTRQHLCPLGESASHLADGCKLLVTFRSLDGTAVSSDPDARIEYVEDRGFFIKSEKLCTHLLAAASTESVAALFFEGTSDDARCIVKFWPATFFPQLDTATPELRLAMYGLPPETTTLITAETLLNPLYHAATADDPELFAVHATRFLNSPHVIMALFSHLTTIRAEDNIRFPIQVKKLADQLRSVLVDGTAEPRIATLHKSHRDLWTAVQGQRFAFVDGGAARVAALHGLEPHALRVGVYSVRPGVELSDDRERWAMRAFVHGDVIDRGGIPVESSTDPRRLQEALRYTLEPLVALLHLQSTPDTQSLFLHGPLVNQFLQYDDGPPSYVPFLSEAFLSRHGISREGVLSQIRNIPTDAHGAPKWNQFMAIYAFIMQRIFNLPTAVAGVVERPTGRLISEDILYQLEDQGRIDTRYQKRVLQELRRFDITDDFLFGCILREGEYLTPVAINKNSRASTDAWRPVAKQIPSPYSILLKSQDTTFPFRVELNSAGRSSHHSVASFLYHTARLLPRYAFPVGLDIVDKFAKVPDWIAKGITAELASSVLQRALRTRDTNVISQIRTLLAHSPRDFFFRPDASRL
jgi:hypothetical protein